MDKLCVIDDSTSIMMISLETKKLIRRPLHLDKQITFNQLLTEYVPLSEKGSPIYFVDRGCGYVLQLRNDSIVRIDKSFHHQNQFGGAYFLNNGVPSIFGGYGLFSSKNFITQFDIISKEWDLVDHCSNLPQNAGCPYFINAENLFIIFADKFPKYKHVWRFNFSNKIWYLEGHTNYFDTIKLTPAQNPTQNFNIMDFKIYFLELDFENNKIYRYKIFPIGSLLKILKYKNKVVKLQSHSIFEDISSFLTIHDNADFKKDFLIDQSVLLVRQNSSTSAQIYMYVIIIVILFIIILLFYTIRLKKKKHLSHYKMNILSSELLNLWVFKRHGVLELSDLNDLVNAEHLSLETMKKRRELLLKSFVSDMAKLHQVSESTVYTEAPNPIDKRMKLLTLHPKIMDIALKKGI